MAVRHSRIAKRVSVALQDDPRTRDAAIDVAGQSGLVTLAGSVTSDDVRQAAEEISRHQEGVVQVINDLQIEAGDEGSQVLVVAPPLHDSHGTLVSTRGGSQ
jgi:osmotically-inducible protein OsmY